MTGLSSHFTSRLVSHGNSLTAPGSTVATLWNLETPPLRVRLVYFNFTQGRRTIDAACVATSTAPNDGCNPAGPDGTTDHARWQPVTFPGSGGSTPEPSRVLTLDRNPNGSPAMPHCAVSDWITTEPVKRIDGGAGALLMVRTYSRGQLPCVSWHPASGLHAGIKRDLRSYLFDGDRAADPGTIVPGPLAPQVAPFAVEYVGAIPGVTVIGIGDSILSSQCTSGRISGPGLRACAALSTPELPVSWINEAYAGRRSEHFHQNGIAAILLHRPQIALIQCWSGNDGESLADAQTAFDRSLLVADVALRHDCTPVLLTAAPCLHGKPQVEASRAASNAQVRAMAARGFHVLDLDQRWGTGSSPNAYQRQYWADSVHPNDRAAGALAEMDLVPLLSRIIAERLART